MPVEEKFVNAQLNKKCFLLPPPPPKTKKPRRFHWFWKQRLIDRCDAYARSHLGLLSGRRLKEKLFPEILRKKKGFLRTMKDLSWVLEEAERGNDESIKQMVFSRIFEELSECPEGRWTRCRLILTSVAMTKTQTFPNLLHSVRQQLVLDCARESEWVGDGVHRQNQVSQVAASMGLGVLAINESDSINFMDKDDVKQLLKEWFEDHYRPMSLLFLMIKHIKGVLIKQGYRNRLYRSDEVRGQSSEKNGEDINGEDHQESANQKEKVFGYQEVEYSIFQESIEKFLREDRMASRADFTISDFLILDKDSQVIDINWPFVFQQLFLYAHREKYFNDFSDELFDATPVSSPSSVEAEEGSVISFVQDCFETLRKDQLTEKEGLQFFVEFFGLSDRFDQSMMNTLEGYEDRKEVVKRTCELANRFSSLEEEQEESDNPTKKHTEKLMGFLKKVVKQGGSGSNLDLAPTAMKSLNKKLATKELLEAMLCEKNLGSKAKVPHLSWTDVLPKQIEELLLFLNDFFQEEERNGWLIDMLRQFDSQEGDVVAIKILFDERLCQAFLNALKNFPRGDNRNQLVSQLLAIQSQSGISVFNIAAIFKRNVLEQFLSLLPEEERKRIFKNNFLQDSEGSETPFRLVASEEKLEFKTKRNHCSADFTAVFEMDRLVSDYLEPAERKKVLSFGFKDRGLIAKILIANDFAFFDAFLAGLKTLPEALEPGDLLNDVLVFNQDDIHFWMELSDTSPERLWSLLCVLTDPNFKMPDRDMHLRNFKRCYDEINWMTVFQSQRCRQLKTLVKILYALPNSMMKEGGREKKIKAFFDGKMTNGETVRDWACSSFKNNRGSPFLSALKDTFPFCSSMPELDTVFECYFNCLEETWKELSSESVLRTFCFLSVIPPFFTQKLEAQFQRSCISLLKGHSFDSCFNVLLQRSNLRPVWRVFRRLAAHQERLTIFKSLVKQENSEGHRAFERILIDCPTELKEFFVCFNEVVKNSEEQPDERKALLRTMLFTQDRTSHSPLMSMLNDAEKNENINICFSAMKECLVQDEKEFVIQTLLKDENSEGFTVLMLAAETNSEALNFLIRGLLSLAEEGEKLDCLKKILSHQSSNANFGAMLLMVAAERNPVSVIVLLEIMQEFLGVDEQKALLREQLLAKRKGLGAPLHGAVCRQPWAIQPVLSMVGAVFGNEEDKSERNALWREMLIQPASLIKPKNATVFQLAKLKDPQSLKMLVDFAVSLDDSALTDLLPSVPFLKKALKYCPNEGLKILKRVNNLDDPNLKAEILARGWCVSYRSRIRSKKNLLQSLLDQTPEASIFDWHSGTLKSSGKIERENLRTVFLARADSKTVLGHFIEKNPEEAIDFVFRTRVKNSEKDSRVMNWLSQTEIKRLFQSVDESALEPAIQSQLRDIRSAPNESKSQWPQREDTVSRETSVRRVHGALTSNPQCSRRPSHEALSTGVSAHCSSV